VYKQIGVTSSKKVWEIILELELDVECFRTKYSEVNMQFEVTSSIRNGKVILEME